MSRAFVKEQDDKPEELAERPVSSNPNFVTVRGLRLIDAEIEAARRMLAAGQHDQDKSLISRASRDLRYWTQRRASAQLREAARGADVAGFGMRVTIMRNDHRKQEFAIVGEDEADPVKGYISYVSPLARALMGRSEGDVVDIPGGEAEIMKLEPVGPEG
jgi:transcription elongation GreA/GreB family factor